ncbi:hypothetical protein G6011_04298 [Alternaria panax]|uniref:F-box domain-containing protein n=1 Tax=Alternaria panax TaxID=48097 RepID=A0AAD4IGZ3_9PLEO|nr:hypothetical protein G6011_04298 [Alternaria panax]
MGSFDCYCILCAVTLNIGTVVIGSRKGKDLRKRERNVDKGKRRRAGGGNHRSEVESEDDDSGAEDAPDDEAINERLIELQEQAEDDADSDFEDEDKSHSSSSSEDAESIVSNDSDLPAGSFEITDVALRPRTPEPEPEPNDSMDSDSWSQASDLSLEGGGVPHNDSGDFDEEDSFDPRLIRLEDLLWLNRSRALALNHESDRDYSKAYFSGRGLYGGLGGFDVKKPGRDPNDPGESSLNVTAYDGEENMAFPFHEACFNILANSIGPEKGSKVDKDVMREVIRAQLVDQRPVLDIDYKLTMAQEQFWINVPGEEYAVCDPGPRSSLREEIQGLLPASILDTASEASDLSNKVRNDPTHVFPYDILLEIIGYMDTEDMLSFMKASYHVNSYTREAAFWKHMIRVRILPWFDELGHFVENTSTDALDYKGLFLWISALTRPELGNQGPFMHIVNRRRIWGCCQPLASLYKRMVGPVKPAQPMDSEEAKAIMDSSVCLSMLMTMYPSPDDSEVEAAQFIHAWYEIGHRSCILDTYWRRESSSNVFLVGISITLGGQKRLFGSAEGVLGRPLHIEHGEWIKQIICHVDEIDMININQDRSTYRGPEDARPFETAYIRSLQIRMTSGRQKFVVNNSRSSTRKPLLVADGMYMVGLTGQIAPNGAISRLGLLQAPKPQSTSTAQLRYNTDQQLSWKQHAMRLPYKPSKTRSSHYPIWSHPSYHHELFPVSTLISPFDPPEDMMSHDIFLWDSTPIVVFQPVGATMHSLPGQPSDGGSTKGSASSIPSPLPGTEASSVNMTFPSYQFRSGSEIVGISPGPHNVYGGRGRGVGYEGPVPAQHPRWTLGMKPLREALTEMWKELYKNNVRQFGQPQNQQNGTFGSYDHKDIAVFPLDSESITEVHVEHQYRALKFVTQSGRVGCFGVPGCKDWWVRKAVKGERFVGISTCFGSLGGWSQTAMMWSHWKLSRVGVVFERVDEEGHVVSKDKQKVSKGKTSQEGKIEVVTTEG